MEEKQLIRMNSKCKTAGMNVCVCVCIYVCACVHMCTHTCDLMDDLKEFVSSIAKLEMLMCDLQLVLQGI